LVFLSTKNSFHQIISKKAKITILFLMKNPKINNTILLLVFHLLIQRIGHTYVEWNCTHKCIEKRTEKFKKSDVD
jgi:hypothetical protein